MSSLNSGKERTKKRRSVYTPFQVKTLTACFNENGGYLDYDERDALAAKVGMSIEQIQIWFQNLRARLKREMNNSAHRREAPIMIPTRPPLPIRPERLQPQPPLPIPSSQLPPRQPLPLRPAQLPSRRSPPPRLPIPIRSTQLPSRPSLPIRASQLPSRPTPPLPHHAQGHQRNTSWNTSYALERISQSLTSKSSTQWQQIPQLPYNSHESARGSLPNSNSLPKLDSSKSTDSIPHDKPNRSTTESDVHSSQNNRSSIDRITQRVVQDMMNTPPDKFPKPTTKSQSEANQGKVSVMTSGPEIQPLEPRNQQRKPARFEHVSSVGKTKKDPGKRLYSNIVMPYDIINNGSIEKTKRGPQIVMPYDNINKESSQNCIKENIYPIPTENTSNGQLRQTTQHDIREMHKKQKSSMKHDKTKAIKVATEAAITGKSGSSNSGIPAFSNSSEFPDNTNEKRKHVATHRLNFSKPELQMRSVEQFMEVTRMFQKHKHQRRASEPGDRSNQVENFLFEDKVQRLKLGPRGPPQFRKTRVSSLPCDEVPNTMSRVNECQTVKSSQNVETPSTTPTQKAVVTSNQKEKRRKSSQNIENASNTPTEMTSNQIDERRKSNQNVEKLSTNPTNKVTMTSNKKDKRHKENSNTTESPNVSIASSEPRLESSENIWNALQKVCSQRSKNSINSQNHISSSLVNTKNNNSGSSKTNSMSFRDDRTSATSLKEKLPKTVPERYHPPTPMSSEVVNASTPFTAPVTTNTSVTKDIPFYEMPTCASVSDGESVLTTTSSTTTMTSSSSRFTWHIPKEDFEEKSSSPRDDTHITNKPCSPSGSNLPEAPTDSESTRITDTISVEDLTTVCPDSHGDVSQGHLTESSPGSGALKKEIRALRRNSNRLPDDVMIMFSSYQNIREHENRDSENHRESPVTIKSEPLDNVSQEKSVRLPLSFND